jgi:CBS domain-containing protein
MRAYGIMTTAKIAASVKATARELSFYMTLGGFSGIPITEGNGQVVGIVSEQDLIQALNDGKPLDTTTAAELMTQDVISVAFDTPLEEILAIFATRHVLNLPVVEEGRLVGMVARGEVLRAATQAHLMTWVA